MCNDCAEVMDDLGGSSASVKAEWQCPVCGDMKFEKEANPIRVPSSGIDWTTVAFFFFAAVVACVYFFTRSH